MLGELTVLAALWPLSLEPGACRRACRRRTPLLQLADRSLWREVGVVLAPLGGCPLGVFAVRSHAHQGVPHGLGHILLLGHRPLNLRALGDDGVRLGRWKLVAHSQCV